MKPRNVKQVIVMRKDLNMRKGKMIAQGAHASVDALLSLFSRTEKEGEVTYRLTYGEDSPLAEWLNGMYAKICLYVESEEGLVSLYERIRKENPSIPVSMIEDAGLTEFHGVETKTCIGIGPWWSEEIDIFTGELKLL
ncbi:aminoacyl-tRNA hydrolase [uncultured Bacteroides sp.]|uniref:aminoacyl-tRNA hydrolase n=1 Tax=uncultured Bacteroides sp. TaxID=162156 RepID=UPI00280BEC65|nr:aminoacyl-tRNA hydrolase [uncultured Bacteroides sp.]